MTKSELRKIYLEKQKSLTETERIQFSHQIYDAFFGNFDLKNIRFLHIFLSIEKFTEIETSFIVRRIWKDFPAVETVVPRADFQTMTLESLRFTPETKLAKNRWGIFEPTEREFVENEKIDLVLVPLLCFDQNGFRVGYGKGFYDKFLSECRSDCLKIGLSYFAPIDEISDAQTFDVKLDFCITPDRIIEFEP